MSQPHAFLGKGVQVRGFDHRVPVTGEIPVAEVVSEEDDDVGPGEGWSIDHESGGDQGEECESMFHLEIEKTLEVSPGRHGSGARRAIESRTLSTKCPSKLARRWDGVE